MYGQSRHFEATLVAFTLIALVCGCLSCGSHKASPDVLRVDRDGTLLPPHALLRLGTLRHRIPEECWAIEISPDGKWVATGSMPGSLRNDVEVWDRESGTRLATLVTKTNNIVDIAWSPTGDRIWVAHDRGIEAFRPTGGSLGRIVREYPAGVGGYYELCATKDGQRVAAYHPMSGLVQVWDRDLRPIWKQNVFFDIEALAMSGDGLLIAFGGDGCLQVQSPDDADPGLLEIDVPGKVTSLDFSPDRSRVVAAVTMLNDEELRERKSRILVWNPETGELVGQSEEFPGEGTAASYSADGQSIITGNWIDTIDVWDARTLELRRRIVDANRIGRSTAVASEQPIAVSAKRAIGAWNYSNGSELLSRDAGHVNWVNSVEFVDGGQRIVTACPDGLRVWDAKTGEQLATPVGAEDGAWGLATSANGRFLAFGRRGGDVAILDRQSNAPARVLSGHVHSKWDASVAAVDISPDGVLVASAGLDEQLIVWNFANGEPIKRLPSGQIVFHLRLTPDRRYLVYGRFTEYSLHVVELGTWKTVRVVERIQNLTHSFDVAPDGSTVAMNRIEASTASDDPVYRLSMQNLRDGKVIWERESPLSTLRFSPDGKLLAAASQFGPRIKVYSVYDGAEVASLDGHAAGVSCLAFSPDGTRLASCSADTTVLVWDLAAAIQAAGNWIDRRRTSDAF